MRALRPRFRSRMDGLRPVNALQRHPRILLAPELERCLPVPGRREEKTSRVGAKLLLLLQSVARVRAVDARSENPSFTGLDRLARLLVLHDYSIENRFQRPRRHGVRSDVERVAVGPEPKLSRLGIRTAARESPGCERQHR